MGAETMAEEHELIMREGLSAALAAAADARMRANLKIAADILAREAENPAATTHLHSILCTIYLPHRRTSPDEVWQRTNGEGAVLMIQPTKDEQGRYFGVPYGATGRLMMIYLQNEAYRNRSREVELGRSMHAMLKAMGAVIRRKPMTGVINLMGEIGRAQEHLPIPGFCDIVMRAGFDE